MENDDWVIVIPDGKINQDTSHVCIVSSKKDTTTSRLSISSTSSSRSTSQQNSMRSSDEDLANAILMSDIVVSSHQKTTARQNVSLSSIYESIVYPNIHVIQRALICGIAINIVSFYLLGN